MASPVLLDELLALERAGWDSLCDGTGDKYYGGVMTSDAVMVLANGMIMDRPTVASALGDSPPWAKYDISDPRVIQIDADNAALVYIGKAYRGEDDEPFVGAMSSVYHRTGDTWSLVLYQQSEVSF